MTPKRRLRSAACAGAATLALTACSTLTACSGPGGADPAPSSDATPRSATTPMTVVASTTMRTATERISAIEAALALPRPGTTTVVTSGPLVWQGEGGGSKDQSEAPHPPGAYELTLYCAGSGTVAVAVTVGAGGMNQERPGLPGPARGEQSGLRFRPIG